MAEDLAQMQCEPCRVGAPKMTEDEIRVQREQVPDWLIASSDGILQLEREYQFKDFATALSFTNLIGALAERQGHHPALLTEWGKVRVNWWTHKIGGLHRNDFIMAAKTDAAYDEFVSQKK